MAKEEPSYMMFARDAVKRGESASSSVVKALVERIDRMEAEKAESAR